MSKIKTIKKIAEVMTVIVSILIPFFTKKK
jgi:hypothetical protein